MPSYEMPLLIRTMSRPELVTALKRAAEVIFDQGGIIRKIENLGTRDLPYKIKSHGTIYKRANRFVFTFVVPPSSVDTIKDEFSRDVDVVRSKLFKAPEEISIQCTLDEELLPPAYRKEVQKMVRIAESKHKPKFQNNCGLDYYPFQK